MRPMELGQGSSKDGPGPGAPPGITSEPPPAASPAPELSAESESVAEQAPAAGQGAGSGSPSISGPSAGDCPVPEAGSEVGAQCASAFSAVQRHAQSVPSNSDAPETRLIFQEPLGPRATGLGIGNAEGIWKTPAACIGRRPGVSGSERAVFIRNLQEALCSDQPSVKKITQEDVKVMLNLLEERERDLNTAARVSQSLVKQNSVLTEENSKLEAMLGSAREEILHLRHQVSLRDDLLQLYSDSDEEEEERKGEEEKREEDEEEEEQQQDHTCEASELTSLTELEPLHSCPQLGALQEQLRLLVEENEQLREEAAQLDTLEEEEQMLILECVEQFSEASQQMAELSEVLVLRMENYDQQQKEVTQLQTQIRNLQQRCQSYGAEAEKLQQQLASEKEIQMQLQEELQDLREKYMECEGRLNKDREGAKKTLRQEPPLSAGCVTQYTYTVPLEALPDFQEALAKELRKSMRRMISNPVFFMERNYDMDSEETSDLDYELHCSDEEQEEGFESEEGSLLAEELVSEEELGTAEEVVPTEEGVTEDAELVSEEAEAWEEVEPELDEATPTNVVSSALEASSLGPSNLDVKYVLQQLANWQDTHYRRRLRQRRLQKGSPTLQQWQQQAKTNMGGGIMEQQPRVLTQDFPKLEEDRANHPPMVREEERPSGATQAAGIEDSVIKDHSQTRPLGFAVSQPPPETPQTL